MAVQTLLPPLSWLTSHPLYLTSLWLWFPLFLFFLSLKYPLMIRFSVCIPVLVWRCLFYLGPISSQLTNSSIRKVSRSFVLQIAAETHTQCHCWSFLLGCQATSSSSALIFYALTNSIWVQITLVWVSVYFNLKIFKKKKSAMVYS